MTKSIGNRPDVESLAMVLLHHEPFNVSSRDMFQPLSSASLWGRPGSCDRNRGLIANAKLSDADRDTLETAQYVVFSYNTPIAWQLRDGRWMVPTHRYSNATARHIGTAPTDADPRAGKAGVVGALFWNDVREENGNIVRPGK